MYCDCKESVTYVILTLYGTDPYSYAPVSSLVTYVSLTLYGTDSNIGLISQFQVKI